MKLIVGLGNPGPHYAQNRHNVGYQCIERLAQRHSLPSGRVMFKAFVTSGHIAGVKTVLARPLTFMNLSGQAVRPSAALVSDRAGGPARQSTMTWTCRWARSACASKVAPEGTRACGSIIEAARYRGLPTPAGGHRPAGAR